MTPVTYEPTPTARLRALKAIAADGDWYHFTAYDAICDGVNRVFYIVQDDWLPEPGKADPVAAEWAEVLAVAERLGIPGTAIAVAEPAFDHETGIWVWVIPFSLN